MQPQTTRPITPVWWSAMSGCTRSGSGNTGPDLVTGRARKQPSLPRSTAWRRGGGAALVSDRAWRSEAGSRVCMLASFTSATFALNAVRPITASPSHPRASKDYKCIARRSINAGIEMAGAHEQQPTGLGERHGGAAVQWSVTPPAAWTPTASRWERGGTASQRSRRGCSIGVLVLCDCRCL